MKFKSNIEIQAGLEDKDGQVGSSGQILASTGSQVDWIDPANIVTSATDVIIECKNTSGVTISKGTPVYQTGNVGATAVIEIAVADASDEDKMAAIGLLQSDLINNAFGYVVVTGELLNITTSPIDGSTPTVGDTIYVKPGGGLTLTKPTGVNFIQNVGLIGKVSGGNAGSITVSSIMRSNDVPTPLYIDHDNQRLGIGTTSPAYKLDVNSSAFVGARIESTGSGYAPASILLESGGNDSRGQGIYQYNIASKNSWFSGVPYSTTSDDWVIAHKLETTAFNSDVAQMSNALFCVNDSGFVGIGTTNSAYKLQVYDASSSQVRITNGLATPVDLQLFASSSSYAGIGTASNHRLALRTNNTEKATILANGNVGIGTTSPSEKLDVAGNIKIQSALLSNQENTDVDTGTETVANVAIATYTAAFFDFVVKKTTNVRSGTVYACHDGTNVEFTETSTNDLGDTSDVTLSVDISGTNMRLLATVTSDDWSVKSLIRAI